MSTSKQTRKRKALGWPKSPYKGLSYYGPEDAPLFAGRKEDVRQCAQLLARPSTRVLILHGATGCGKSSFLRAGLIPYLEDLEVSYHFMKEGGDRLSAIFIRSTDKPLVELAKTVYNFAKRDVLIDTPLEEQVSLELPQVVEGYTEAQFIEKVGDDGGFLTEKLREITARLTSTLVVVVDQGEEVLTLRPDAEGDPFRKSFFKFVARLSSTGMNLKLLIALRTDYYGRFVGHMQRSHLKQPAVTHYLLDDLTPEQIVSAIERPTERDSKGDYGAPFDFYGFEYEPGLPQKITEDLMSKKLAGGILPVMQIVCDRLYHRTRPPGGGTWKITKSDYRSLGSIEDQLEEHFNQTFEHLCGQNGITDKRAQEAEADRWKGVLTPLAKSQPDGTVTTDVKKAQDLSAAAKEAGCRLDFGKTMEYLDKARILRQVTLVDVESSKPIDCYSLGHDAIGLVLVKWKATNETSEALTTRLRKFMGILGVFLLVAGLACIAAGWAAGALEERAGLLAIGVIAVIYGVLLLAGSRTLKLTIYKGSLSLSMPPAIERFVYGLFARYARFFSATSKQQLVNDKRFLDYLQQHPHYLKKFEQYLP